MRDSPDTQTIVERVLSKYGGRDAARLALDHRHAEIATRWDQDSGTLGRIVRSHLFVEYYLEEYLLARNPNLRHVPNARLTYAQKLELAGLNEPALTELRPGIKRLNAVRNRLAHNLRAELSAADVEVFLSAGLFVALRKALVAPSEPSTEPIVLLEDFARHCGIMLSSAIDNSFESCFSPTWDESDSNCDQETA